MSLSVEIFIGPDPQLVIEHARADQYTRVEGRARSGFESTAPSDARSIRLSTFLRSASNASVRDRSSDGGTDVYTTAFVWSTRCGIVQDTRCETT